jgi:ComF family protein
MGRSGLLARGASRLSRIGVHAVFPLRCWQCNVLYAARDEGVPMAQATGALSFGRLMDLYLCPRCAGGYAAVRHPLCPACGRLYGTDQGVDHLCDDCLAHPKAFEAARAAGVYAQPLKTLIHQYKYKGRAELARPLGRLLWDALLRFYDPREFDVIIPVPLHWFRRFRRGFNQADLLVRQWWQYAAHAGIAWKPDAVAPHLLSRRRRTPAQSGLGRRQRLTNLKKAFSVPRADRVRAKRVLLVDDVMTTGTTVAECTKVLMSAGAEGVKVLTLARAD